MGALRFLSFFSFTTFIFVVGTWAEVPSAEDFYQDPIAGFSKAVGTFRDSAISRSKCISELKSLRALIGSVDGGRLSNALPSGRDPRALFESGSVDLQVLKFTLIQLMHEYHAQQQLTREEADEFKAAVRVLRTLDERMQYYVRWVLEGASHHAGTDWWKVWKSRNDRLLRSPQYAVNLNWQSISSQNIQLEFSDVLDLDSSVEDGDVVLTLGDAASEVSQLIMNISAGLSTDSDFSHVFTIRKKGGKVYKIEGLIEDGTHFRSWNDFKKKRYARFVVMRFRDQDMAKRGQEATEQKIRYIKEVLRKNIIYNARMEALKKILTANSGLPVSLNCFQTAECIWIFGHEGSPPHSFPEFPTIVSHKDPYALDYLTIPNHSEMPHPGDLNTEPSMVPILEYRDSLLTHQAFLGRVILTFILKKMTEEGYRIKTHWKASLAENVLWPIRRYTPAWLLRHLPLLKKLEKAFNQDMDRQLLAFSLNLKNVVSRMFPEVLAQDQKFVRENGAQMPSNFEQAMRIVERVYASNVKDVQSYLLSGAR